MKMFLSHKVKQFSYTCVYCIDYMQIAIRLMTLFHNFMTFDRSVGCRREFYTRKKEIRQCYCVNLLMNVIFCQLRCRQMLIHVRAKSHYCRGQKCLLMSRNCLHNEKPSATSLFTKGQNLVADGQTLKMLLTTSGAGQTETNLGKQKQGCFVSEMTSQVICSSLYVIDFAVKLITFSFPNNMNPTQTTKMQQFP